MSLRTAGNLLLAESRLRELQTGADAAVEPALQALRLGVAVARGGVVMDSVVGLAVEETACRRLEEIGSRLTATGTVAAAQSMLAIDATRGTAAETVAAERSWAAQSAGAFGPLLQVFDPNARNTLRSFKLRHAGQTARTRFLAVSLAVHAYKLEHGNPPGQSDALVPAFLAVMPNDPRTGKPLGLEPPALSTAEKEFSYVPNF